MKNIDKFTSAYAYCALWSSTGEDCDFLSDNFFVDDISEETIAVMASDCANFQRANASLLAASGLTAAQAGVDFWLTRNGHGAGFRDMFGVVGESLAVAAEKYKPVSMFVGEDGKIYSE